jgi:hypothetical protein
VQAAAHTMESQLAALSERSVANGSPVPSERQFVDDGTVVLPLFAQRWIIYLTWWHWLPSITSTYTRQIAITLTRFY